MKIRKVSKKKVLKVAKLGWSLTRFALIFILGFVILYPLLQMISRTFMPVEQYADPSVIWIPKSLTLTNIKSAMIALDFWPTLGRTLILAFGCAFLQVISCAIVGYGFARFQFRFRGLLFAMVIVTIVVPTQLIFIPLMVQYRFFDFFGVSRLLALITGEPYTNYSINLLDSNWTFFLPSIFGVGLRSGLFIYIYRQFFRNMPRELDEAARIDGCGPWRTFTRVMLPNAKASALTVFLFSFIWHYNETMMSNSFFATGNKPLAVALQSVSEENRFSTEIISAGLYEAVGRNLQARQGTDYAATLIFISIPLLLYIFAQKYFVEGVESTGIKG